jgi:hypothetical protein
MVASQETGEPVADSTPATFENEDVKEEPKTTIEIISVTPTESTDP